jgi:hypothetical protein
MMDPAKILPAHRSISLLKAPVLPKTQPGQSLSSPNSHIGTNSTSDGALAGLR